MKITIVTLFPEYFDSFQTTSIIKRALEHQRVELELVNFRDYTLDKHHNVGAERECCFRYSRLQIA